MWLGATWWCVVGCDSGVWLESTVLVHDWDCQWWCVIECDNGVHGYVR